MFWIVFLCIAVSAQAQTYEELFRDAGFLSAAGDYEGAARKYEAALRLRPGAPEALSNAGVMYYMAGRYPDAESILAKALRAQPELIAANLIRGLSLVRLGRFPEALDPLQRVLAREPANRDAVLGLASTRVALGQLEEAAGLYRQQTERAERDADAWHGLALTYERMAELQSRQLSTMPGGAAYGKRFLGEYWLDRGQHQLAEEAFAEAYTLDPAQPGLAALLVSARAGETQSSLQIPEAETAAARVYLRARQLAELSRGAFKQFVEIAPESWQAQLFLGDVNRQQHRFEAAIGHYQAAARLRPDSPAPLVGLGTVHWELAQDEAAIENLEKVRKLAPENVQALFALGNIALKQRRDAAAIELLRECLRLAPAHNGAHADIGKAYLHLNRPAQAVGHLNRALAIDVRGDVHFQLGQALRKLGRERESTQAFDRSRQLREQQLEREQRLRLGRN